MAGPGAPAPVEPLHLSPGLCGEPQLPFCACQSNPVLGSSSVAKRKQISKHTSACPPFLSPPPRGLCSRLPRGSVASGLSQAELKPKRSGAEVGVGVQGGVWGGSERY